MYGSQPQLGKRSQVQDGVGLSRLAPSSGWVGLDGRTAAGGTGTSWKSKAGPDQATQSRGSTLQGMTANPGGPPPRTDPGGPAGVPGLVLSQLRPDLAPPGHLSSAKDVAAAARAHSSLGLSHIAHLNGQAARSTEVGGLAWPTMDNAGANGNHPSPGLGYGAKGGMMSSYKAASQTGQGFNPYLTSNQYLTNEAPARRKGNPSAHQMFASDPSMLLQQHTQCQLDNKERLKGVKNLEELVHFKVRTLADHLQEEQQEKLSGPLGLAQYRTGHSQNTLAGASQAQSQASINALKKICDPLLANRHYPKLLTKKAAGGAKNQRQFGDSWQNFERAGDLKQPLKDQSFLEQRNQSLPSIADSKMVNQNEKNPGQGGAKGAEEAREGQMAQGDTEEGSETFRKKRDQFLQEQDELRGTGEQLKREHNDALAAQGSNFQKRLADKQMDPVKLLKSYFDNKKKAAGSRTGPATNKKVHSQGQKSRSQLGHQDHRNAQQPNDGTNLPEQARRAPEAMPSGNLGQRKAYAGLHPNFIVAKYEKMRQTGKLARLDQQQQLQEWNSRLDELHDQMQEPQSVARFDDQNIYQNGLSNLGELHLLSQLNQNSRADSLEAVFLQSRAELAPAPVPRTGRERTPAPVGREDDDTMTTQQPEVPAEAAEGAAPDPKLERIQEMRQELKEIFDEDEDHEVEERQEVARPGARTASRPIHQAGSDSPRGELGAAAPGGKSVRGKVAADVELVNDYTDLAEAFQAYRPQGLVTTATMPDSRASNQDLEQVQIWPRSQLSEDLERGRAESAAPSQDELVQEKLMRILAHGGHQQPPGQAYGGPQYSEEGARGTKYSELLKYQSVKTSGAGKSYVSYTPEQIELANKLRQLEAKQSQGGKRAVSGDQTAAAQQKASANESKRVRCAMTRSKKQGRGKTTAVAGVNINLQSSLPQIKHELERKKFAAPPIGGRKAFKEDHDLLENPLDEHMPLQAFQNKERRRYPADVAQLSMSYEGDYMPADHQSRARGYFEGLDASDRREGQVWIDNTQNRSRKIAENQLNGQIQELRGPIGVPDTSQWLQMQANAAHDQFAMVVNDSDPSFMAANLAFQSAQSSQLSNMNNPQLRGAMAHEMQGGMVAQEEESLQANIHGRAQAQLDQREPSRVPEAQIVDQIVQDKMEIPQNQAGKVDHQGILAAGDHVMQDEGKARQDPKAGPTAKYAPSKEGFGMNEQDEDPGTQRRGGYLSTHDEISNRAGEVKPVGQGPPTMEQQSTSVAQRSGGRDHAEQLDQQDDQNRSSTLAMDNGTNQEGARSPKETAPPQLLDGSMTKAHSVLRILDEQVLPAKLDTHPDDSKEFQEDFMTRKEHAQQEQVAAEVEDPVTGDSRPTKSTELVKQIPTNHPAQNTKNVVAGSGPARQGAARVSIYSNQRSRSNHEAPAAPTAVGRRDLQENQLNQGEPGNQAIDPSLKQQAAPIQGSQDRGPFIPSSQDGQRNDQEIKSPVARGPDGESMQQAGRPQFGLRNDGEAAAQLGDAGPLRGEPSPGKAFHSKNGKDETKGVDPRRENQGGGVALLLFAGDQAQNDSNKVDQGGDVSEAGAALQDPRDLQKPDHAAAMDIPQEVQRVNIKQYVHDQLRRKVPILEESDRGYHSSTDPHMDKVSAEMYDQIIQDHLIRRGCWIPSRFKKFPRFTIFTQKDELHDKSHLINQVISLNPQVLALLAASDITNLNQLSSVLEEPAVTNRSSDHRSLELITGNYGVADLLDSTQPHNQSHHGAEVVVLRDNRDGPNAQFIEGQAAADHYAAAAGSSLPQSQQIHQEGAQPGNQDVLGSKGRPMIGPGKNRHGAGSQNMDAQDALFDTVPSRVRQFDPFDKVLLTKGIDNQILTSFRTLNKSNNMISNTLKVVHQRFQPKALGKSVMNKVPRSKMLYPLNREIYDGLAQPAQFEQMDEAQKREYMETLAILNERQRPPLGQSGTRIIAEEVKDTVESLGGAAGLGPNRQSFDDISHDLQASLLASNASGFEATGTPAAAGGAQGKTPVKGMGTGSAPQIATVTVNSQSGGEIQSTAQREASQSPQALVAERVDQQKKNQNPFKGRVGQDEGVEQPASSLQKMLASDEKVKNNDQRMADPSNEAIGQGNFRKSYYSSSLAKKQQLQQQQQLPLAQYDMGAGAEDGLERGRAQYIASNMRKNQGKGIPGAQRPAAGGAQEDYPERGPGAGAPSKATKGPQGAGRHTLPLAPGESILSGSMIPTPSNPLHGHVGPGGPDQLAAASSYQPIQSTGRTRQGTEGEAHPSENNEALAASQAPRSNVNNRVSITPVNRLAAGAAGVGGKITEPGVRASGDAAPASQEQVMSKTAAPLQGVGSQPHRPIDPRSEAIAKSDAITIMKKAPGGGQHPHQGADSPPNQSYGAQLKIPQSYQIRLESSAAGFAASKDQVHSWSKNQSISKGSLDLPQSPHKLAGLDQRTKSRSKVEPPSGGVPGPAIVPTLPISRMDRPNEADVGHPGLKVHVQAHAQASPAKDHADQSQVLPLGQAGATKGREDRVTTQTMHSGRNWQQSTPNARAQPKAIPQQSEAQKMNLDNVVPPKDKIARKTTNKFVAGFHNTQNRAAALSSQDGQPGRHQRKTAHRAPANPSGQARRNSTDQAAASQPVVLASNEVLKMLSESMGLGFASSGQGNLSEVQNVLLAMAQGGAQRAGAAGGLSPSAAAVIGGGVMVADEKLPGAGQRGEQRAADLMSSVGLLRGAAEKHQVKKMIDEIYQKEKKYTRRQVDRVDMVHSSKLIFDLSKARPLDRIEKIEEGRLRSRVKPLRGDPAMYSPPAARDASRPTQAATVATEYGGAAQGTAAATAHRGKALATAGAAGHASGRSTADSHPATSAAPRDFIKGMRIQVNNPNGLPQPDKKTTK